MGGWRFLFALILLGCTGCQFTFHDGMYRAYVPMRAWRRPIATIERQNMQSITVPNAARYGWRLHRRIIAWDDQRFVDPRYVPPGTTRPPEPSSNANGGAGDEDDDPQAAPLRGMEPPVPQPNDVPPGPETTPSVDSPETLPPEPDPPPPVAKRRLDGPLLRVNATQAD